MTRFEVQYVLPVNDPVNNIGVFQRKKFLTFLVPINHPVAHNIGLQDLLAAVERQELLGLSTPLNNKSLSETLRRYYRYGKAQKKEKGSADDAPENGAVEYEPDRPPWPTTEPPTSVNAD